MDDIRKLRNLLYECDKKINFKKYDENIKDFYNSDFSDSLNSFTYDERKIKLKKDINKNEYAIYREYLDELNILKEKCDYILKNNISIEHLNIPRSFYKGDVLLLDDLNNVRVIIDLLNTLDEKECIYHNISDTDFALLTRNIKKSIDHKGISIQRKYHKMNEEEIIKDILRQCDLYYISKNSFSAFFALLEKKKSKRALKSKKYKSILKIFASNLLPALILVTASIFIFSTRNIEFIPLNFSSGVTLKPIIDIIVKFSIFGVVIWAEAMLSRELLNNFKIMHGVSGYWTFLLASLVNLFMYISKEGNVVMSVLVWLTAVFYGFWCGPNFRKKAVQDFSLLGRLLVTLTVMDFYFMIAKVSTIHGIVVAVLLLVTAILPVELKKIENSPWYSRG